MGLFASLGLKPPKNRAAAAAGDMSAVTALQADLKAALRDTVAYANQLKQPAAKAELAGVLKSVDTDRKNAEAMPNVAEQVQALKATLAKIKAAADKSKDQNDEAKGAALALRGKLEADEKKFYAAWAPLADEQAKLGKEIAAAKGDNKKALEAIKKDVDARAKEAHAQLEQISADVQALSDPLAKRETFTAILARQKSGVVVAAKQEIDKHDQSIEKKLPGNSKETRTTTEYADGKAVTSKIETETSLGLGGASKTKTKSRETITADGSQKSEQSETGKVSASGLSYEKSVKGESEKDGKTTKAERKTSAELGPDGASITESKSKTNADGSGTASSNTSGVERGDGKVGKVTSSSESKTDTSGTTTTTGQKTKTGMIAGKDGMGAFAETNKSYEKKGADGVTTGAVAGLTGNVVCNVTAVPDTDPPMYELSMTVSFGASVGASKGQDKEGASGKAKLAVNASQAVSMKRTYRLDEKEAKVYVDSLKAASKGGTGAATQEEFAIIRSGVSKGWDTAREMYLALSGKAAKPEELAKLKTGESREVTSSTSGGADVSANVKAVGVELGVLVDRERSAKVTKEEDGSLTYDTKASDSTKKKGKVSLSMGLVEGSGGASHSYATSTGYQISVDPKDKDAKAMQDALANCSSQADLDAFAAKYPQAVKEKTSTTATADTESVGMGVAGVKARLDMGNSLDTSVTTDGAGKMKRKKVVGGSNRGGEIAIGSVKLSGSSKEQVEANIDAQGNVSADVTRADTSTDIGKFINAHNPFAKKDKDKKTGALTALAGGAEAPETDSKEVYGIRLSGKDLARLGQMACNDKRAWNKGATSPRQIGDWEKARKAIAAAGGDGAVVAEQLAVYIGSDKASRLDSVNFWLRPGGKVSTGTRYEFPDALQSSKASYLALVVNAAEATLETQAQKDGAAKAVASGKEMLVKLDALYKAIEAFTSFSQPAVRAEMLSAINTRRGKVQTVLQGLEGGQANDAAQLKEKTDTYVRVLKACIQYQATQDECFAKIDEMWAPGRFRYAIEIAKLLKQLSDLHAVWWPDYRKAEALGKEIGKPEAHFGKFKPDSERLDKTGHKVRIQG